MSHPMTFDEIARELKVSRAMVWLLYTRALTKLRRRPAVMAKLKDLADAAERERDRRIGGAA